MAPTAPLSGLRLSTCGSEPVVVVVTSKLALLVSLPPGVATKIGPSVAPDGTFTVICVPVPFTRIEVTEWPLNCTWDAPAKFVPLIVTLVPTGPLVGLNPVMVGGAPAAAGRAVTAITRPTITADAPTRFKDRVPINVRLMTTLPWIDPMSRSSCTTRRPTGSRVASREKVVTGWSTQTRWARVPGVLGTLRILAMGGGAIILVLLAFGLAIGAIIALIRLK